MRVLGLCGRKLHGKDTFARILMRHDSGWRRIGFADELKAICRRVFGLSQEQVSDPGAKEQPFLRTHPDHKIPYPDRVHIDDHIDTLRSETGLDIIPRGKTALNPRQILQFVGTEYIRFVKPDYWLECVRQKIEAGTKELCWIITDARFANEADFVRSISGRVLRVLRLGMESSRVDHASEELDFEPDFTLAIMENNLSLPDMIAERWKGPSLEYGLRVWDWPEVRKRSSGQKPTELVSDRWFKWARLYYGGHVDESIGFPEGPGSDSKGGRSNGP